MHSHVLRGGSSAATASRRIRNILGAVLGRDGWMWKTHEVKLLNTSSGDWFFFHQKGHSAVCPIELDVRYNVLNAW